MAEDLGLLINQSRGEGPSPRFVADLRARIVAETSDADEASDAGETGTSGLGRAGVDDSETIVVELDIGSAPEPPFRWWRSIAAVAAVLVIGFGAFVVVSDSSTVTTTIGETPSLAADAELLTDEFTNFEPGSYRVDAVGVPFTFTVEQPRRVAVNSQGRATIMHVESQEPGDRVIAFMRLSTLSDPRRPAGPADEIGSGWPADDFDGWLDAASNWIVVSDRQETTLGGLDTVRADIELVGVECDIDAGGCPLLGTNRAAHGWSLHPGWRYRIWIVDLGVEDPLAIIGSVNRPADREWLDTADMILSSLAFGQAGANPVHPAADGATELAFHGGVELELQPGSFAVNEPGGLGRIPFSDWAAETVFLTDPLDLDGKRLATVDGLVAALGEGDVQVAEVEGTTIDGLDARSFEIMTDGSRAILRPSAVGGSTWSSPPRGRMWAIEHPDRGLLVITAEVSENIDLVFPLIDAESERILRSLRFVDLG